MLSQWYRLFPSASMPLSWCLLHRWRVATPPRLVHMSFSTMRNQCCAAWRITSELYTNDCTPFCHPSTNPLYLASELHFLRHRRSSSFLGRWFQPLPLRFRQKFALKVLSKASDSSPSLFHVPFAIAWLRGCHACRWSAPRNPVRCYGKTLMLSPLWCAAPA